MNRVIKYKNIGICSSDVMDIGIGIQWYWQFLRRGIAMLDHSKHNRVPLYHCPVSPKSSENLPIGSPVRVRYSLLAHALINILPQSLQWCMQHCLMMEKHDDVMKWKHFPRYWPFVRGIHGSPMNSPHKGQWHWALMFPLICARINAWVNNREAGDLRRYRAHYDVTVMGNQYIPLDIPTFGFCALLCRGHMTVIRNPCNSFTFIL